MSTTTAPDLRQRSQAPADIEWSVSSAQRLRSPAYQAYLILRSAFVVAPILFGIDKFFNWMTYWPKYLWAGIPNFLHVTPSTSCMALASSRLRPVSSSWSCPASPPTWWPHGSGAS